MSATARPRTSSRATPLRVLALTTALPQVLVEAISRSQPARSHLRKGHRWHDASFFESFSAGESTYDDEGDYGRPHNYYIDGWAPTIHDPYKGGAVDPSFFHESPSGGPARAWQTHNPTAGSALPWSRTAGGGWQPEYRSDERSSLATRQDNWWDQKSGANRISAGFFDAVVEQYDNYGRKRYPASSVQRFASWQERAVNTTLQCQDPGCEATAALQAFNGNTEQARSCKLSVYIKPTDFEQRHSTEAVQWISVNGANVSLDCRPKMSGCNATQPLPYYPCVRDVSLDKLITSSGTLQLAAKISDTVDECPYQGSLLYAVPIVACLIAPQVPAPYFPHNHPTQPAANLSFGTGSSSFDPNTMTLQAWAPLKCRAAGCSATSMITLNATAMTFSQCTLSVKVNATDFDNREWQQPAELLEFVKVAGSSVATNINPRANPCKSSLAGRPISPSMIEQSVVTNQDVTADARDGVLLVEAKISPMVDECAAEGNLLDGLVNVVCSVASVP